MKFKHKHMQKLDNPKRREILPPDKVLGMIQIKPNQVIADVGCGIGYFTIPMAHAVGENGKVYAIDINQAMLDETKKRVESANLHNIEIVLSGENNFKIKDNSVDMVFTATVFHELLSPEVFLNECKRVLIQGGTLVILDWNKIREEFGPPINSRVSLENVKDLLIENGFNLVSEDFIDSSFYIVKFVK